MSRANSVPQHPQPEYECDGQTRILFSRLSRNAAAPPRQHPPFPVPRSGGKEICPGWCFFRANRLGQDKGQNAPLRSINRASTPAGRKVRLPAAPGSLSGPSSDDPRDHRFCGQRRPKWGQVESAANWLFFGLEPDSFRVRSLMRATELTNLR